MNIDINGNSFKSVLEKFLYRFSQAEAIITSLENYIPKDVSNTAKR